MSFGLELNNLRLAANMRLLLKKGRRESKIINSVLNNCVQYDIQLQSNLTSLYSSGGCFMRLLMIFGNA
jgi:hypothetical protein